MIRIDGDADAHLDAHVMPIERHRLVEAGKERARGTPCAGQAGHGQERGEFIAAQAGHRIRLSHRAVEARPHFFQEEIARVMAPRIVDVLEAIQIYQEQSDAAMVTLREAEGLVQTVEEQAAVGQPGEGVGHRHDRQLRALGPFTLVQPRVLDRRPNVGGQRAERAGVIRVDGPATEAIIDRDDAR